jgi:N-acetylglucosamine-6-phosphate deacetylase
MDATAEAFLTAIDAHARHGTTSIVPTTTVAPLETIVETLQTCRGLLVGPNCSSRILGLHLYGPYFGKEAAGCHPTGPLRDPAPAEYERCLIFRDVIVSATVAPELPGAEAFARACHDRGILVCVGHSHCSFSQMEEAIGWGTRHVDHLFCAMSDRARMRQTQAYPMRGGLVEATLYFDQVTTEVIADGKHLTRELLLLALKVKGPDRLALVTDCNRALDMPDGEYIFGPKVGGQPILRVDGVGLMPDGTALASSVRGMDHMVRTFHALTGCPLHVAVRMASLTPARIIGKDRELGSLEAGKFADLVLLDDALEVRQVWVGGRPIVR